MEKAIEILKNKVAEAEKSNLCVGDSRRDNGIYKNGYIAGLKVAISNLEAELRMINSTGPKKDAEEKFSQETLMKYYEYAKAVKLGSSRIQASYLHLDQEQRDEMNLDAGIEIPELYESKVEEMLQSHACEVEPFVFDWDGEGSIVEAEKKAKEVLIEKKKIKHNIHIRKGDVWDVVYYRKPCDLSTVKKYTADEYTTAEKSIVEKVVLLKNENFESLTFDFFRNCDHIISDTLGNRIGGFNRDGLVRCVCVVNKDTDEKIFINCEGYDYARYVGLSNSDILRNK